MDIQKTMKLSITDQACEELRKMRGMPLKHEPEPDKVLIVEDNMSDSEILRNHLTGLGCEVYSVPTAIEAMTLLNTWRPAKMVMVDLSLPVGPSGAELIRKVLPTQRVCIVTGYATPELIEAAASVNIPVLIKGKFNKDDLQRVLKLSQATQMKGKEI